MTNYLDLLPTDVSELIYKKKFHLELVDGLKKFDGFWNIKLKLPKVTNFKIGDETNKGFIHKITPCYYYVTDKIEEIKRYPKKDISRYIPKKVNTLYSRRVFYFDSGSVWYKPNPVREKYSDYLSDRWVDSITELKTGGIPMVCMDNPYLTLYLEVNRPELGVVWDKKVFHL